MSSRLPTEYLTASTTNTAVGALAVLGGLYGYARKRSVPSLVAGVAAGGLLIYAGYLEAHGDYNVGNSIALGTSSALFAVMASRAMTTRKFMPAGLVSLLAVGAIYANYSERF